MVSLARLNGRSGYKPDNFLMKWNTISGLPEGLFSKEAVSIINVCQGSDAAPRPLMKKSRTADGIAISC